VAGSWARSSPRHRHLLQLRGLAVHPGQVQGSGRCSRATTPSLAALVCLLGAALLPVQGLGHACCTGWSLGLDIRLYSSSSAYEVIKSRTTTDHRISCSYLHGPDVMHGSLILGPDRGGASCPWCSGWGKAREAREKLTSCCRCGRAHGHG